MADPGTCLPLTATSILTTHARIAQHIHQTPLLTSQSLSAIASSPDPRLFLTSDPPSVHISAQPDTQTLAISRSPAAAEETPSPSLPPPKVNVYLKCENQQRIGAFKARGAFSAVTHLIELLSLSSLRTRGVITHSSGNHAQALALAVSTFSIPAWIVMPTISTPSKISGTKSFSGVQVVFSGSTSREREEVVARILAEREAEVGKGMGPVLVPPYDHPDIMLGQGTSGLELERQFQALHPDRPDKMLDVVMIPLGGGGLLSGNAIHFSHNNTDNHDRVNDKKTRVFGCEPSFQGANDGELGLKTGHRVEHVSTLTIADGLRTPIGKWPWTIITDPNYIAGIYSVTEDEIKSALKLLMERAKLFVEPSSAVPLAVLLFNEAFRAKIAAWQQQETEREGRTRAWDVAIILSGGNTTIEALTTLFRPETCVTAEQELKCLKAGSRHDEGTRTEQSEGERMTGQIGLDGKRVVEDIAG